MNTQEIEAKFHVRDLRRIELRLQDLKARLIQPRTHETNLRFDRPDRELRNSLRVLRLRQDTEARLTFKGPSTEAGGGILKRQEIEFTVPDYQTAKHFLEALGFQTVVFYEKYRTTYEIGDTHIMLDELPHGDFLEIEGRATGEIRGIADQLELRWDAMIKAGYHALFDRVAVQYGLDAATLSFDALRGIKIDPSDMKITPADQ